MCIMISDKSYSLRKCLISLGAQCPITDIMLTVYRIPMNCIQKDRPGEGRPGW